MKINRLASHRTFSSIGNLRMLQRHEAIKDASQRKEVAFRLKVIEFQNSFDTEDKVDQRGNAQRGGQRR
ncbi:MAG: hypothetical protein N2327_01845 [Caldimicrobium sp.]|nr:hypothetical protein [Caldimicrobium sp.]MCX7873161.1 hypothetical protein [Caldimicrobium sp.]MDW8094260.1 hypothetical protein [Caldimicrobium sp.]